MSKFKAPYHDKMGCPLPGVTSVTGELGWNKQTLIGWANKLGLKGVNCREYVDDKADIGTLAHSMVLASLSGVVADTSKFTQEQIEKATNCLASFNAWKAEHKIKPIIMEHALISNTHRFAGTPDFYGEIDGVLTLNDYKTGSGIYDESLIQVGGGYLLLLEENGYKVERIQLLNIPRADDEKFDYKELTPDKWGYCKKIFLNALENYQLHKEIKFEYKPRREK